MNDNNSNSPVCAHNEWDPLEEVIVGIVDGAHVPPWHVSLKATLPENQWDFFRKNAGSPFPQDRIDAANEDLESLVGILEKEGVTVRRPEPAGFDKAYATPDFESSCGLYAAMPRDYLLVVGEEIIESPMAWRSRFHESRAYRSLLKEYFRGGAKWTAAPKPELKDELYNLDYIDPKPGEPMRYVITDSEPTFDAADFVRCGRDLFGQLSNVTNQFGVDWLRRHLGSDYRVHLVETQDTHPMHIDASLMPLAPGKVLINPERVKKLPEQFANWDVLVAPRPTTPDHVLLYMTSKWISMNILMLDEKRVIVEKEDREMIAAFHEWGFDPIPCPFRSFNAFGGSFHCATADVRRRGQLQSYFD